MTRPYRPAGPVLGRFPCLAILLPGLAMAEDGDTVFSFTGRLEPYLPMR